MSLESATKISELVASNPPGTDPVSQGDDHIRMIKNVLQLDAVAKTGPQTMEGPLTLGDYSGQLAGFRNILINGNMRINQRGVTIAAAAIGEYGQDRWKKVDASNMTQIVEEFNYRPSTVYTLSGTGVTTQQITSPASGHWTLPNIPITATNIQLEEGSIATPFEQRPIGFELSLCQRYYEKSYDVGAPPATNLGDVAAITSTGLVTAIASTRSFGKQAFKVTKRVPPTISYWDEGGNASKYTVSNNIGAFVSNNVSTDTFRGVNASCSVISFQCDVSVSASPGCAAIQWVASAEL